MSVKLVFSSTASDEFRDDSGFCYCRRNARAVQSNKSLEKIVIELTDDGEPTRAAIDFGSVPVDSIKFREIILVSKSGNVPAEVTEDPENVVPIDSAFRFAVPASLPSCAGGTGGGKDRNQRNSRSFRVYFEPELPGMHYAQSLDLCIGGIAGARLRMNCRGDTFGPAVCFSENQINFGGQYYRDETKRGVKLINLSDCEAKFQFDVDNNKSTFRVCPTAGVIPPQTTLKLELTFRAPKPQAYYKRIICLVLHQQPQHLDLFGVCVPRPFLAPVTGIGFEVSSFKTQFLPLPSLTNDEYLESSHFWGITLSSDQIDFGYHEPDRNVLGDYEPLSLSSSLPYDVIVEWTPDASEVFVVSPQSAILPAHRSTLFKVSFCPNFPNVFYSGLLEFFIHPIEYNWPPEFGPPWALVQPAPGPASAHVTTVSAPSSAVSEEEEQEEAEEAEEESQHIQVDAEQILPNSIGLNNHPIKSRPSRKKHSVPGRASRKSRSGSTKKSRTLLPRITEQDAVPEEKTEPPAVIAIEPETVAPEPVPEVVENTTTEAPVESYFKFIVNLAFLHSDDSQMTQLEPIPFVEEIPTFQDQDAANTQDGTEDATALEDQNCQIPQQLGLPLCLTLRVLGHTFQKPPPVTNFNLPRRVLMDVTWPLNRICRTIYLKNDSDFPVQFDSTSIEEHGVFRMKPNKGVIPGHFHQLALVTMLPTSPHSLVYVQNSNVLLNVTDRNKISLCGLAELPRIDIIRCYQDPGMDGTSDGLSFPMTVPYYESSIVIQLVNPTRYYCNYAFALVDDGETSIADKDIFGAKPSEGTVQPYEFVEVTWTFRPLELLQYKQFWKCIFNVQRGHVQPRERLPHFELQFPVYGFSDTCQLLASPAVLDYDLVELFSSQTKTFTVTNKGNAVVPLYLKAIHEQWLENYDPRSIIVSPSSVTIQGQESVDIQVTIRPYLMTMERFNINCFMDKDSHDLDDSIHLCSVRFIGDHPLLKVNDINHASLHPICDGTFAWSMFSLDKLNKVVGDVTHSLAFEGQMRTPPTVSFNFPPAPLGSESAIFTLLLSNKGRISANWEIHKEPPKILPQFIMDDGSPAVFDGNNPSDPKFLSSLWSRRIIDKYRKSAADLDLNLTREKNICFSVKPFRDASYFKVIPQSGKLEPHENVQVTFRYTYKVLGAHDIYYLLRVNPSIFVWLHVKGRTLEPDKPYVQHFYDKEVQLVPVSLSDMDPPIQLIWLYNGGTVPAKFKINSDPFRICKNENFGHSAFDLVDKRGIIPPRSWGSIKIRFCPIEMKDYYIQFVAKWDGGETLIKVHGPPLIQKTTLLSPSELGALFAERYSLLTDPVAPVSVSPIHVTVKQFVPTGQQDTSVVFLTNLSEDHEVSFSWPEKTEIDGGGSITFRPCEGIIQPKDKVACQITIYGGSAAIMCTTLIRCSFTDVTEEALSSSLIKKWDACKSFLLCNRISEAEANTRLLKKYGQRPEPYEPCSKVISITLYVTSAFGMLDCSSGSAQTLRPPIPPCKPLPAKTTSDIQNLPDLTLPPFAQLLSREILRSVLWDIVHSESFENFEKLQGHWKAPKFEDYELSEKENVQAQGVTNKEKRQKHSADAAANLRFPLFGSHEVLKEVLFNLLAELDGKFEPEKSQTLDLRPVPHHQLYKLEELTTTALAPPTKTKACV